MRNRFILLCLLALATVSAQAQNEKKWYDNIKLSGYGMLQYQGDDKEGDENNSFNLRLLRMIEGSR